MLYMAVKYVTEYWPQANGLVEWFKKVLLKHVQTSLVEGKDWKTSLPMLLINYRAIPHGTTGETPSQLLMQRELKTKLPSRITNVPQFNDLDIQRVDEQSNKRERNMLMHNEMPKQRTLKPGEYVLLQQKHQNKFSTNFHKHPVKVIKVNGTQIVFKDNDGQVHQRNSAHIKKIQHKAPADEEIDNILPPSLPNTPEVVEELPSPVNLPRRSSRNRKAPEYFQSGYS